jgi:hypothetical protein
MTSHCQDHQPRCASSSFCHETGVNQIKGLCGQGIGATVVALDLYMRLGKRCQHAKHVRVDVGDQDMAGGAAALSKPSAVETAGRDRRLSTWLSSWL